MRLPELTLPFVRLPEVLANWPTPSRNECGEQVGCWSRSISLGTTLDEDTPALPLPLARANELFLMIHEMLVLACGDVSDWPGGDAEFWPETLGIEKGALLAVWDYDYYAIVLATRPQPDGTAYVELMFATGEQIRARQSG